MNVQHTANRCALVTGGTRGIGRAIVLGLAAAGVDVGFSYLSSTTDAEALVLEIEKLGVRGACFQSDQADASGAEKLVNAVHQTFGRLDILVNNAGIATLQKLGTSRDYAELDRLWAINTLGVVATIRAAAHVIADGGRIISIGSLSGRVARMPAGADYCGSKAALGGYTRGAAHDLAPRNVTVNLIESGMMNSEMAHNMPEGAKARVTAAIPLQRFGNLEEIAGLVTFLVSPAASYITGATLTIDGGLGA